MRGEDGRVRVMDFGLVRADGVFAAPRDDDAPAVDATQEAPRAPLSPLTRASALVGTPYYMSHEQFSGGEVDARSDQFSFCVALYEALYGARPFAGDSVSALARAVAEDAISSPPESAGVPAWLRRVVVRGLAREPARRWPSMRALLEALADDPVPRRRRRFGLAASVSLLGGATWWAATLRADATHCTRAADKLAGAWDDDRRGAARAGILATRLSYAPGAWTRVERQLDDYASAWVDAHVAACVATRRGEQSAELLDRRMACLDGAQRHLTATVERLARADVTSVERAVEAVERLPRLDACADLEALMAARPRPTDPALAREVDALDEQLVEARALKNLGDDAGALAIAERVAADAERLEHRPLQVRARALLGVLQHLADDNERAAESLRWAYRAAILEDMPDQAASAARALVVIMGGSGAGFVQPEQGRAWALHAEAFTRAAGGDEELAEHYAGVGAVALQDGKPDEARASYERALEIYQALDPEHPAVHSTLRSLAFAELNAGQLARARELYTRALELLARTRDPTHPAVGRLYLNLGELAGRERNLEEAQRYLEAALGVFEQAYGTEHSNYAATLAMVGENRAYLGDHAGGRQQLQRALEIIETSVGREQHVYTEVVHRMGNVAYLAKDYDAADALYEQARAGMQRRLGPDNPSVGYLLTNLAMVALLRGEPELALARARASQAIFEPIQGPTGAGLRLVFWTQGEALIKLGRAAEAVAALERSLAVYEKALGPEHAEVVLPLTALAKAHLERGAPELALPQLERADTIAAASEGDPALGRENVAEMRFLLARALWDAPRGQGRDRARSLAQARRARDDYAALGEHHVEDLGEVTTWLQSHVI